MNAIYFATACIMVILIIYWGSAKPEPQRLKRFFGQRPRDNAQAPKPRSAFSKRRQR